MPRIVTHEPAPSQPAHTPLTSSQPAPVPAVSVPAVSVPAVSVPAVPVPDVSVPCDHRRGLIAAHIDDLLGPARHRYFGEGYRRVGHEVRDVVIDCVPGGRGGVSALAWVAYPADWASKRAGIDLRPHVSSIDMLVIGAQLCEAFLVHRYGLDAGQRRRMWLRRIDAKAGCRPQEELAGFAVTARHLGTGPLDSRPGTHTSTFDCLIGTMRMRCEVGHELTEARAQSGRYERVDQLLGPPARRYYGAGYRDPRYEIRDVSVDSCNTYAECVLRSVGGGEPASIGLESDGRPDVSMAESIVMTAQMSEVILYRIDRIDRAQSNTMWLRTLRMERPEPATPSTGTEHSGSIAVSKSRVVDLNGARWRVVDMVAYCQGIEQTHSLAHELPASADPADVESSSVQSSVQPGGTDQGEFR